MKAPESTALMESTSLDVILPDFTFILVAVFFFAMLGTIYWLEVYEFPRQRLNKLKWLRQNNRLHRSERLMVELLEELGRESTCCSKCGNYEMRMWDMRDRFLVIRCTSCGMNRTLCEENKPIISKIRKAASSLQLLVEFTRSKRHGMLGQYLLGGFRYNYFNRQQKEPGIRAITFTIAEEYPSYASIEVMDSITVLG